MIAVHLSSRALQVPPGQCPVPVAMHYWEHSLQLLFYKLSLKVSDHGSRRTLGPSSSRSRFGVWKGDPTLLNQGRPAFLFNKVFTKMQGWGSRGTLYPLYTPHTQVVRGTRLKFTQESSPLEDHLCAKFHPDMSSSLDFLENRHTHTQTLPIMY